MILLPIFGERKGWVGKERAPILFVFLLSEGRHWWPKVLKTDSPHRNHGGEQLLSIGVEGLEGFRKQ